MNKHLAVALLDTRECICHIKHMVTNPYSQLEMEKESAVHGADEYLLHSIIRKFKKEGIIKHVIITFHSYKDEALIKKGWVAQKPEDSLRDETLTTRRAPSLINHPYSRRKKSRLFSCFCK